MRVKVHTAGNRVKGRARRYPYYVASLFEPVSAKGDDTGERFVWRNTGRYVGPFTSLAKTEREGKAWAEELGVDFAPGIGSLHNELCEEHPLVLAAMRA